MVVVNTALMAEENRRNKEIIFDLGTDRMEMEELDLEEWGESDDFDSDD